MNYFNIISAIYFFIGYQTFSPYMAYIPVSYYSINNPDNNNINNNKNEQIYREMHIAD